MSENSTNGIDVLLEKKFKRHLKKDERIVWAGTSLEGYESGWIFSEKSLHLVFGLLVGIMTLMFTLPTMLVDGEINFVAVAIVAVCAVIVANSFRKPKLKKAFFAVTNKRILTLIWGQLFQTALKDVVSAELRQRTVYESGMLIEANDVVFTIEKFSGNVRRKDYIGGFSEENAENVRRIIEEESAKALVEL
ncbi:MAG: hypothetical protein J6A05_01615 [Oscillospiraceae bacterium]|nr:hypothetical protein [Oscillospiraceae bacterium]